MNTPAGSAAEGAAPLNGTNGVLLLDAPEPSVELIWSPVRFAPLGPIGRESSTNEHELEVQMHLPSIGSQKGVEQLAGRRWRAGAESVAWGGFGFDGEGCSVGQPY